MRVDVGCDRQPNLPGAFLAPHKPNVNGTSGWNKKSTITVLGNEVCNPAFSAEPMGSATYDNLQRRDDNEEDASGDGCRGGTVCRHGTGHGARRSQGRRRGGRWRSNAAWWRRGDEPWRRR